LRRSELYYEDLFIFAPDLAKEDTVYIRRVETRIKYEGI
jgi:hypothetical protein